MKYRLPELKDKEIIKEYIKEHYSCNTQKLNGSTKLLSMNFEEVEIKENKIDKIIKEIDPLNMTPLQAINLLYELKEISKNNNAK